MHILNQNIEHITIGEKIYTGNSMFDVNYLPIMLQYLPDIKHIHITTDEINYDWLNNIINEYNVVSIYLSRSSLAELKKYTSIFQHIKYVAYNGHPEDEDINKHFPNMIYKVCGINKTIYEKIFGADEEFIKYDEDSEYLYTTKGVITPDRLLEFYENNDNNTIIL